MTSGKFRLAYTIIIIIIIIIIRQDALIIYSGFQSGPENYKKVKYQKYQKEK